MELYPAIDLRAGRCVRLLQGDYARETVYGEDPVAVACAFAEAGARWIHVVDLDAARTGDPVNRPVVAAIAAALAGVAQVQTGGGVRSIADAVALAATGIARVVMGTAAVQEPSLVEQVATIVPVVVGLDHRGGEIAIHGWTEGAGVSLIDALGWFPSASAFVVTEIGRDGMLSGPDLEGLGAVLAATSIPLIASGGVSSLVDLDALLQLHAHGRSVAGVIAGMAIYEGVFTVAEGVLRCASPG